MDEQRVFGEKIRMFRKRAGMSQFELEIEMEAASGMMSRIESGKVNPTKETILKLIKPLTLKSHEIANLFSINDLILSINTIFHSLDLDTTLQVGVDIMIFNLLNFFNSTSQDFNRNGLCKLITFII